MRTSESTYRPTDAYPCAMWDCGKRGTWVETRPVRPNGLPASLGFYGWCDEHLLASHGYEVTHERI